MKLGNPKTNADVQMSEAFVTSVFLALSGGFQDAYTYFTREEVFSNAQTGNIVLMSTHLMMGEWLDVLRYLLPLLAFASGVFFAEKIHVIFKYAKKLHWRQGVLLMEIAILVFVGFMPKRLDLLATVLVSFACAMQVQTFRKVSGYSYASTMCIGNLRSGTEAFTGYLQTHDTEKLKKEASVYPNRSFGEKADQQLNSLLEKARMLQQNLAEQGVKAEVLREEPFTTARDSLDFQVFLMIWKKGWRNRKVEIKKLTEKM